MAEFAGRAEHLAALDDLLAAGRDAASTVLISAIGGTAGVGKTALAVHWAQRVRDRFTDGQLYLNLRGFDPAGPALAPAAAVRAFLLALGVAPQRIPATPHAQAALYRSLLAGRRMLVLLDNARDSDQVRPLLPGSAGSFVLVTSRNQLTGLVGQEGAYPLTLNLMTPDEARTLLARRLGADRVAAEPAAVDAIIARCARLPLALAIVAGHAATRPKFPLSDLAARLDEARGRLDVLTAGDPTSDLRAVLSCSYDALTPPAARQFRLLGLHPGPDISIPAAASLAGRPAAGTRTVLAELTRASLIVEHSPGRYHLHDLLRAYAAEQTDRLDPDGDRDAAIGRFLDHYRHTAQIADALLSPQRDPIGLDPPDPATVAEAPTDHAEALAWFGAERAVLLAAVDHAVATGRDTLAWQLAWLLTTFLERQGHWHDWAAVQHVAVAASRRLDDPPKQAIALQYLARACTRLDRLDDAHAHLTRAVELYQRVADQYGQARTHLDVAVVCERQGRYAEALDHAQQALDLDLAAGRARGTGYALNMIAWLSTRLGDYRGALEYCRQALAVQQEIDNDLGEAHAWDSLGYAHHHLGDHAEALACYQHALDLFRHLGDRYHEATVLTHHGDTHHSAGDLPAARTAWQHALTIMAELDHPDAAEVRAKLSRR